MAEFVDAVQAAGALVCEANGSIVASKGSLEDNTEVAKAVVALLNNAALLMSGTNAEDKLRKVTITFDDVAYGVTISDGQVFVVQNDL
ncbi:uncharacterized protein AMSG_09153 [Thecamonas trahens ATCC 50062]|uniref:Late endosomal/lysosomal adaptor and MAPK and MTOR activator 4 n=1 Tax=Thecamonas trahens ATCC 50062 TaxID=461836 RepID=A0A0L0DNI2_THETB|nr:hypothetical protein AMSG_09153 [Thecamonas trahens ATCC 50062]KNC52978.1 hypothetical protein AMSG_09153 [Thecamonas trahens ATCC 50062]|eukprot:XP_013754868.1 hypothetical protein AMSG_09153 [Thecamonas trahens ATCC 50062]